MKKFIGFVLFFCLGAGLVWGWQSGRIPRMLNRAADEVKGRSGKSGGRDAGGEGTEGAWSGTWRNEKYNTSGKISCQAEPAGGDRWKAHFFGEFQGEPFSYKVDMTGQKEGARTVLSGKANVDGDAYRWEGYISDQEFVGNFKSEQGNYGQFKMRK